MSCNFPMVRAETFESYINQKGGKSYKAEIIQREQVDAAGGIENLRKIFSAKYRKIEYVGCGQCIECLLGKSRQAATQIMLQKKYGYQGGEYPDGTVWFITATYNDENLPTHKTINTETGELFEGISLNKEHHKKFIKKLRKLYPKMKISYVMAGEYGSSTLRPHYHYIIFGLPLDQTDFKKIKMSATNEPVWQSEKLNKIWRKGMVAIGRVTWESAAYVARYTLKKANKKDANWYAAQGMLPEFIIWSNGMGKDYFIKHYKEIYSSDTVPITKKSLGGLLKPPRSYDRMLKEIDPELYQEIKHKRDYNARIIEKQLNASTDLTPEERRIISEARMKQVMKDIRTEV